MAGPQIVVLANVAATIPHGEPMTANSQEMEREAIRRQLAALDLERKRLEYLLEQLPIHGTQTPAAQLAPRPAAVTNASTAAEKVALF